MNTLKFTAYSLITALMMTFFMTSCEQENIVDFNTTQILNESENKLFTSLEELMDFEKAIQNIKDEVVINISQDLAAQISNNEVSEATLRSNCELLDEQVEIGRIDATVHSFTPNNAVWNAVQHKLNYPNQDWIRSDNNYDTYPAIELTSLIPDCEYAYKVRTLCPPCCGSSYHSLKISDTKYFTTYP